MFSNMYKKNKKVGGVLHLTMLHPAAPCNTTQHSIMLKLDLTLAPVTNTSHKTCFIITD